MYLLEKQFTFEAGHVLTRHDGKCSRPHGHNYVLTVAVKTNELISEGPKKNMVIDFYDLSDVVEKMINQHLDHQWLNDSLDTDSPTAEFIAYWIYHYLKPMINGLHSITINETPIDKVTYWGS